MMKGLISRSWLPAAAVALCLAPAAATAQTPQTPADPQTTGTQQQQQQPPPPPPPEPTPPAGTVPPPTTVYGIPGTSSQAPTPYNIAAPAREGRPNRAVFGVPRSNKKPVLTVEGLVGGGMSGDPLAAQRGLSPGGFGNEGGSGAFTSSANLTYNGGSRSVGISASSVFYEDYYPQYEEAKFQPRSISSLAFNFHPTRSTRVVVTQGYKNLPELGLSELLDPDFAQTVPISADLAITAERYGRYGINVDASHSLSRRMKVDGGVGWAHGALTSGNSWETQSVMGTFSYLIGKGISAYAGYVMGAQNFHYPDGRTTRDQHPSIRFGVDYGKALSVARRTTLAFTTGVAQVDDRVADTNLYELVGAVSLKREFGHSWEAGVAYSRNVRYLEAINEPVLSNSLRVMTAGALNRRMQVKASFGASAGSLAAFTGQTFDTYYGGAQLNYGLSTNLSLGAEYAYSRLSNPPGALPIVASGLYTQNAARVFIQFWAPLFSRAVRVE